MRRYIIPITAITFPLTFATTSSKRGLVYIPNQKYPADDQIWTRGNSDITWYYNYGVQPSNAFSNSKLQFVPMLWGPPPSTTSPGFYDSVKALLDSGQKIPYVLSFNEPDGPKSTGGSNMSPDLAASTWIREIEPLKKLGVKVGLPAVTGSPSGMNWLQRFFASCKGSCHPDFVPVHWYGNFEGLSGHIGQVSEAYKNNITEIWVTEYAMPNAKLADSQSFYNQSAALLDRWSNVTHYSWFGAFRSSASNVGPNSAFLTKNGKLTDIGSWYLGGSATGATPSGAVGSFAIFRGWILLVFLIGLWSMIY